MFDPVKPGPWLLQALHLTRPPCTKMAPGGGTDHHLKEGRLLRTGYSQGSLGTLSEVTERLSAVGGKAPKTRHILWRPAQTHHVHVIQAVLKAATALVNALVDRKPSTAFLHPKTSQHSLS